MLKGQITRRSFLKLAGISTVAATAATTMESLGSLLDFSHWTAESYQAESMRIPTQCQGCGANRCGIYAHVKNGRVWKVEGNPKAHNNQGSLCPRGHGYIHELYNPNRIRQPLKRTDEGTFEPISWAQALKEITTALNLIIMEYGPQSLFWLQYPMANSFLAYRFMHALGSPNTISHGSTCYVARTGGFRLTCGALPDMDMANSRYILIIGRNPCGGIKLSQMKELAQAKNEGAKVVLLDPRHSETAALADEWLPVKPGTDLAFLLALIYVLVSEELYDKSFINSHTTGFDNLADEIVTCPPEWAEKVCDIPAKAITRIARELASHKPRALVHRGYHGGYGAGYLNSFQTARAVAIVNALLGNYERTGGMFMPKKPVLGELRSEGHPAPDLPAIPRADGAGVPGRYPAASYSDGISQAVPELALSGELKAGFLYHTNPARTNPNPKRVIEGYRKLSLLVTIDCVMSESAALSHYVLPESFYLERDDSVDTVHSGKVGQVSMVQQVVPPLYDTKPLLDIIKELSKGLGIERYFAFTIDELNSLRLKPLGITLKELKKQGVIDTGEHWKEGFTSYKTPSEKVEIYSQKLDNWGIAPLPRWEEPLVSPDSADPHSFRLIHGKQSVQTNSMTAAIPSLLDLSKRYHLIRVWMNTERGKKLGIEDGDLVMIESPAGKGAMQVRLTQGLHPSALWMPSGYGIFSPYLKSAYNVGLSYNDFVSTYFDPVVGHAMTSEVIVTVHKAEKSG